MLVIRPRPKEVIVASKTSLLPGNRSHGLMLDWQHRPEIPTTPYLRKQENEMRKLFLWTQVEKMTKQSDRSHGSQLILTILSPGFQNLKTRPRSCNFQLKSVTCCRIWLVCVLYQWSRYSVTWNVLSERHRKSSGGAKKHGGDVAMPGPRLCIQMNARLALLWSGMVVSQCRQWYKI